MSKESKGKVLVAMSGGIEDLNGRIKYE